MIKGKITVQEKKIIEEMRSSGKGYNEIAVLLNCKKDRIKSYCVSNSMGGFKGGGNRGNSDIDSFIINFNEKFEGCLGYVSGYTHSDSFIMVKCLKCGEVSEKNAQMARKDKKPRCNRCVVEDNEARVIIHQAQNRLNDLVKEMIQIPIKEIKKDFENKLRELELEFECVECGNTFDSARKNIKYCSNRCSSKFSNRTKDMKRRVMLKQNGKIEWDINLTKLIQRDKGMCMICGHVVDECDSFVNDDGHFIAGNNYPSIDHVLPVAKGGTHTWDNIQLAHRLCNSIKGGKSFCEESKGQLALNV